jgi:flavin-dependent dehydrogenase
MYDAIIVGARCSGAPVARLLAQKGYRILMVDKAQFPSDTVSTHLIWQAGLARAKRWGLLDKIAGLGAPPIRQIRLDVGEFDLAGYPPPLDGIDYALAPRRILLDKLLIDAAVTSGAEFREGFYVNEIVADEGRVTGIRGRTEGGSTVVEKARIVVGADGAGSSVAHAVRAPKYSTRPSTACAYYAYWEGGPAIADFATYVKPNWGAALLPTNDGLTSIVAGLSEALDETFGERCQLHDSLADYQRRRDAAVMPMYESTCDRARMQPLPPPALTLFRALRENQQEMDRFFGTDAGAVSMAEFFAPDNLGRILRTSPGTSGR